MVSSVPECAKLDKGETQVKDLYQQIVAAAREKDFHLAEVLRDQMVKENPGALAEIISAAEVIEKEKTRALDAKHLAIWDKFYSLLSEEERNCVFYSMKKVVLPPKKIILSHGAYNNRLFFIDSGKVTILFPKSGKNTVLAQLGGGNLLGEYSFTSISLCSATAVSYTEVELYCLDNAVADNWHEEHPGLYEKVVDFCQKHGSFDDIARWKSLERRSLKRYPVEGSVEGILLTKDGHQTDKCFRGKLSDMSAEGCAFDLKLSKRAIARALLGRRLRLQLVSDKRSEASVETTGKIVKLSFHMYTDYTIHVKFDKPVKKAHLVELARK